MRNTVNIDIINIYYNGVTSTIKSECTLEYKNKAIKGSCIMSGVNKDYIPGNIKWGVYVKNWSPNTVNDKYIIDSYENGETMLVELKSYVDNSMEVVFSGYVLKHPTGKSNSGIYLNGIGVLNNGICHIENVINSMIIESGMPLLKVQ